MSTTSGKDQDMQTSNFSPANVRKYGEETDWYMVLVRGDDAQQNPIPSDRGTYWAMWDQACRVLVSGVYGDVKEIHVNRKGCLGRRVK